MSGRGQEAGVNSTFMSFDEDGENDKKCSIYTVIFSPSLASGESCMGHTVYQVCSACH